MRHARAHAHNHTQTHTHTHTHVRTNMRTRKFVARCTNARAFFTSTRRHYRHRWWRLRHLRRGNQTGYRPDHARPGERRVPAGFGGVPRELSPRVDPGFLLQSSKQRLGRGPASRPRLVAAAYAAFAAFPADAQIEPGFPPGMPCYYRRASFKAHTHVRALMRLRCCSDPFAASPTLHSGEPQVVCRPGTCRPRCARCATRDGRPRPP